MHRGGGRGGGSSAAAATGSGGRAPPTGIGAGGIRGPQPSSSSSTPLTHAASSSFAQPRSTLDRDPNRSLGSARGSGSAPTSASWGATRSRNTNNTLPADRTNRSAPTAQARRPPPPTSNGFSFFSDLVDRLAAGSSSSAPPTKKPTTGQPSGAARAPQRPQGKGTTTQIRQPDARLSQASSSNNTTSSSSTVRNQRTGTGQKFATGNGVGSSSSLPRPSSAPRQPAAAPTTRVPFRPDPPAFVPAAAKAPVPAPPPRPKAPSFSLNRSKHLPRQPTAHPPRPSQRPPQGPQALQAPIPQPMPPKEPKQQPPPPTQNQDDRLRRLEQKRQQRARQQQHLLYEQLRQRQKQRPPPAGAAQSAGASTSLFSKEEPIKLRRDDRHTAHERRDALPTRKRRNVSPTRRVRRQTSPEEGRRRNTSPDEGADYLYHRRRGSSPLIVDLSNQCPYDSNSSGSESVEPNRKSKSRRNVPRQSRTSKYSDKYYDPCTPETSLIAWPDVVRTRWPHFSTAKQETNTYFGLFRGQVYDFFRAKSLSVMCPSSMEGGGGRAVIGIPPHLRQEFLDMLDHDANIAAQVGRPHPLNVGDTKPRPTRQIPAPARGRGTSPRRSSSPVYVRPPVYDWEPPRRERRENRLPSFVVDSNRTRPVSKSIPDKKTENPTFARSPRKREPFITPTSPTNTAPKSNQEGQPAADQLRELNSPTDRQSAPNGDQGDVLNIFQEDEVQSESSEEEARRRRRRLPERRRKWRERAASVAAAVGSNASQGIVGSSDSEISSSDVQPIEKRARNGVRDRSRRRKILSSENESEMEPRHFRRTKRRERDDESHQESGRPRKFIRSELSSDDASAFRGKVEWNDDERDRPIKREDSVIDAFSDFDRHTKTEWTDSDSDIFILSDSSGSVLQRIHATRRPDGGNGFGGVDYESRSPPLFEEHQEPPLLVRPADPSPPSFLNRDAPSTAAQDPPSPIHDTIPEANLGQPIPLILEDVQPPIASISQLPPQQLHSSPAALKTSPTSPSALSQPPTATLPPLHRPPSPTLAPTLAQRSASPPPPQQPSGGRGVPWKDVLRKCWPRFRASALPPDVWHKLRRILRRCFEFYVEPFVRNASLGYNNPERVEGVREYADPPENAYENGGGDGGGGGGGGGGLWQTDVEGDYDDNDGDDEHGDGDREGAGARFGDGREGAELSRLERHDDDVGSDDEERQWRQWRRRRRRRRRRERTRDGHRHHHFVPNELHKLLLDMVDYGVGDFLDSIFGVGRDLDCDSRDHPRDGDVGEYYDDGDGDEDDRHSEQQERRRRGEAEDGYRYDRYAQDAGDQGEAMEEERSVGADGGGGGSGGKWDSEFEEMHGGKRKLEKEEGPDGSSGGGGEVRGPWLGDVEERRASAADDERRWGKRRAAVVGVFTEDEHSDKDGW
ncbi:hypothetical protein DFJ73DRAFT_756586 [Zopfochytrium polystomum]|nr:hypothetical protein DFJ73DRAFT_756586 [Zopfochytrium polystomum]